MNNQVRSVVEAFFIDTDIVELVDSFTRVLSSMFCFFSLIASCLLTYLIVKRR